MSDQTYNGWANRETWALKLHLDNTESSQRWMHETAKSLVGTVKPETLAWHIGETIRDQVEGAFERMLDPGAYESDSLYEYAAHDIGLSHEEALRMIADVGSLWRVEWREIGRAVADEIAEL